jgi:hypothetical protein
MTSRWRFAPRNMDQVRLCLEGQPDDRMVKADPDTAVIEESVGTEALAPDAERDLEGAE